MNDAIARDPVFGEVARSLQARAHVEAGQVPHQVSEVEFLAVSFRADGLDPELTKKLIEMRAIHGAPAGRMLFGFPAFALKPLEPLPPALLALRAAHDNALARTKPVRIMGVVNVTPDSFSDGGRYADARSAIEHGIALEAEGAHMLDIGGESTRPGAEPVALEEELARTIPVITELARRTKCALSIDTTKSAVARAALDAGATIVNDVSAGRFDDAMLPLVAERRAVFVAMHMQGAPRDMQKQPSYTDVVLEVIEFLRERAAACLAAGIDKESIWIDPGIGFGKTLEHNVTLLRRLPELRSLGLPVLLGVSRKSFIATIHPPAKHDARRLGGTAAAVAFGVQGGAEIVRVHDVAVMAEAIAVASALDRRKGPTGWPLCW